VISIPPRFSTSSPSLPVHAVVARRSSAPGRRGTDPTPTTEWQRRSRGEIRSRSRRTESLALLLHDDLEPVEPRRGLLLALLASPGLHLIRARIPQDRLVAPHGVWAGTQSGSGRFTALTDRGVLEPDVHLTPGRWADNTSPPFRGEPGRSDRARREISQSGANGSHS
jgi:hypothetical protein